MSDRARDTGYNGRADDLDAVGLVMAVADDGDDVLAALGRAEDAYRVARAAWARDAAEAQLAREELAAARAAKARAEEQLAAARDEQARTAGELARAAAEVAAARRAAARNKELARKYADALKDIHGALFRGSVYDLILKACMALTGATRGLYVTVEGADRCRVRAAVAVDGYPRHGPSPFIDALCHKVIGHEKPFVATGPDALAGLPAPENAAEEFGELLAVPSVLMKEFNGVVVLADKPGGFDDDDADAVVGIGDQAGVAVENQKLREELFAAYFSVVGVLADAIEAKDPYIHGHSEVVAEFARRTAVKLTDSEELHGVSCYGGLLHDIGKIGVSDGVLNKPGKLLPEEWTLMQSHVRTGRELLARVPALRGVADVVMYHHEKYDGSGYPEGLKGDAIPLAARIVGTVDAYSAMTAKRSYKDSMNPAEARAELIRCKGTHFDPQVVEAFLEVLDEGVSAGDRADGHGLESNLDKGSDFHHVVRTRRPLK